MPPKNPKILFTGPPGIGKTTMIRKIADGLSHLRSAGFFTAEIREKGGRKGFELIDLNGKHCLLAHVDFKGPHRVGKYGVNVQGFERYLMEADLAGCGAELLIIDEIGKMECLSREFIAVVNAILDSNRFLVGTIALRGSGPIEKIKRRRDINIIEITARNRDSLPAEVIRLITADQ